MLTCTRTSTHMRMCKGTCAHPLMGCSSVRGDLLAFSFEEVRIAAAHSDPKEDHHQDPQRTGNKSDPSFALSSPSFCPQPLPPSFPPALHLLYPLMPPLKPTSFASNFYKSSTYPPYGVQRKCFVFPYEALLARHPAVLLYMSFVLAFPLFD